MGALLFLGIISTQKFNATIKAHFIGRIGEKYINRGAYNVSCDGGKRIITPAQWESTVKQGMQLDLGIIFRQAKSAESRNKCPRCRRSNFYVEAKGGWILCLYCDGRFQVSETEPTGADENNGEIVSPELDTTALDHQKQVLVQNASEDVDNDDDIACFRNIHVLVNEGISLS